MMTDDVTLWVVGNDHKVAVRLTVGKQNMVIPGIATDIDVMYFQAFWRAGQAMRSQAFGNIAGEVERIQLFILAHFTHGWDECRLELRLIKLAYRHISPLIPTAMKHKKVCMLNSDLSD